MVAIANGDVITRLAALALLMGLFGFVGALVETLRRKRSLAGRASAGATLAFAIYLGVQFAMLPGFVFSGSYNSLWVGSIIAGSAAAMLGAAVAATTNPE
jgi:hypothetical protein